jgi:hypothetical protein
VIPDFLDFLVSQVGETARRSKPWPAIAKIGELHRFRERDRIGKSNANSAIRSGVVLSIIIPIDAAFVFNVLPEHLWRAYDNLRGPDESDHRLFWRRRIKGYPKVSRAIRSPAPQLNGLFTSEDHAGEARMDRQ